MKRSVIVVLIALITAVGIGVLESQAKNKHSHAVKVFYKAGSKPIGPNDVEFVLLFCKSGTIPVGAGSSTDTIAYVNQQEIDSNTDSVSIFYINDSPFTGTIEAQAACLDGTTPAKARASASAVSSEERAALRDDARRKADRLEAQLKRSD